MINRFTITILLILFNIALEAKPELVTCTIKGKVIDRNSKNILLHKVTDDVRMVRTVIPIKAGSFEYKFTIPVSEAYYLVFEEELKRKWRPIMFFPENGDIHLTLHQTKDFDKNTISGGELNLILQNYYKEYNQQFKTKMSLLREQIKDFEDIGDTIGAETSGIELKKVYEESIQWNEKYMGDNPSLVSYAFFIMNLQRLNYADDEIKQKYARLAEYFPEHPYTKLAGDKIYSLESIVVGGRYIDFSAPDLEGNIISLSEFHNNQFVLIDFWASWCAPCIKTSRTFVPIYEKYKDKGFDILGIAREFKNSKAMTRTIKREKYAWLNLIELNDENEIWRKYNLLNSTGGTVLISPNGEIIEIDPTAEKILSILQKELSN